MDVRAVLSTVQSLWKSPLEDESTSRAQLDGVVGTYLLAVLGLFICAGIFWRNARARVDKIPKRRKRSVAVLVLGDIGRSPRMMYHAESFAKSGFETFVVGYEGSKPIASLLSEPRVELCYLTTPPANLRHLPFIILAPIKILHQIYTIFETFFVRIPHPPEFIIVQNPPSIPTLALVWVISKLQGCKVIIDWHNLGYTILSLKLGEKHPLVSIAKHFEAYFGRSAFAHLFVTQAMRDHLVKEWDLRGQKVVLHDRPPAHFSRASPSQMHDLFCRLEPTLLKNSSITPIFPPSSRPYSTPFTHIPSGPPADTASGRQSANVPGPATGAGFDSSAAPLHSPPELAFPAVRPDRPALLVTSTSWTPDEDFGLLLDALEQYETAARARDLAALKGMPSDGPLPRVLMVVTGKGPLRERYMREVEMQQIGKRGAKRRPDEWKWVRCVSLWLEAEDYPLLLGSADLGICLHSSSSALDLPMKVVDMFGCGLPVCALDFACLHELVKDGQNGLVFNNAEQLATQLQTLLTSFPNSKALSSLQSSLARTSSTSENLYAHHAHGNGEGPHWEWNTWAENWDRVVKPLVLSDTERFGS